MRWKDGQDVLGKHAPDCSWNGCPGCTEKSVQRPRKANPIDAFFSDVAAEQADWENDEVE